MISNESMQSLFHFSQLKSWTRHIPHNDQHNALNIHFFLLLLLREVIVASEYLSFVLINVIDDRRLRSVREFTFLEN